MLKLHAKSKTTILLSILAIVFVAEIIIMGALYFLQVKSVLFESILDGTLLSLLSAPFIYHFLIKDISIKNEDLVGNLNRQKIAEDALRSSQKELQKLSEKLIHSEEEQRKAIAFELHDSIGQSIFSIKLGIENMLQEFSAGISKPVQFALQDQLIKLQRASEEVRNISMNLRPSMLDDLGLLATVKWFVREFKGLYPDIKFELILEMEEQDIPLHLKIVVFRIIQESLNNMGKHAKACNVKIELCLMGQKIVLFIGDDGQGFVVEDTYLGEGIGLSSMKERVKLSKGEFFVQSEQSNGTLVRAEWECAAWLGV